MARRLHVAVFDQENAFMAAVEAVLGKGLTVIDAFTPYPVHGLEQRLKIPRTRLPVVCFVAGASGLAFALWFQFWSSARDWPLNVGGKPLHSWPAFVPVAFEMTVLCAGLCTVAAFLVRTRLWFGRKRNPLAESVANDRFVLVVRGSEAVLPEPQVRALFDGHGAVAQRITMLE